MYAVVLCVRVCVLSIKGMMQSKQACDTPNIYRTYVHSLQLIALCAYTQLEESDGRHQVDYGRCRINVCSSLAPRSQPVNFQQHGKCHQGQQ